MVIFYFSKYLFNFTILDLTKEKFFAIMNARLGEKTGGFFYCKNIVKNNGLQFFLCLVAKATGSSFLE